MDEYIADKKNIFKFQKKSDFVILNRENETVSSFAQKAPGTIIFFEMSDWPSNFMLTILGDHNRQNAAAALRVSQLYDLNQEQTISIISSFKGLPNRLESIGKIQGIEFVNDTTSTTPIAGIMALKSYPDKSIILIAGGNTKLIPLDEFVSEINKRVKYTVLFEGTALDEFSSVRNKSKPIPIGHMGHALSEALSHADSGDVILFSPGVTHLPIINEFDRGDAFIHAFNSAKKKH